MYALLAQHSQESFIFITNKTLSIGLCSRHDITFTPRHEHQREFKGSKSTLRAQVDQHTLDLKLKLTTTSLVYRLDSSRPRFYLPSRLVLTRRAMSVMRKNETWIEFLSSLLVLLQPRSVPLLYYSSRQMI